MRGTGAGRPWRPPLRGMGSRSDRALHRLVGWYAVGFRLWIAVAAVVAAPLAATVEARRAIKDLAIAVLVNAISRVRVTVSGTVDGVIVSLVSDSPGQRDLPASPAGLAVDSQRDQHSLWVEARWNTT